MNRTAARRVFERVIEQVAEHQRKMRQIDLDVNALLYWDAGHRADEDPDAFIAWIGAITGYTQ